MICHLCANLQWNLGTFGALLEDCRLSYVDFLHRLLVLLNWDLIHAAKYTSAHLCDNDRYLKTHKLHKV